MSQQMRRCLDDLAGRIDERQEAEYLDAWLTFLNDRWPEEIFTPPARRAAPAKVKWPEIHINDAIEDIDLMVLSQLSGCSKVLAGGGNATLNVRCNYGTGIMAFPFGCEAFIMPHETGNLPTARPLGSRDRIRKLLHDGGVPDYHVGMSGRAFQAAERFLEVFEKYPIIGRNVWLYHPDAQGPIDIVELVWGSDMFTAFYDDPDLMRAFLEFVTETYIAFMREWFELAPPRAEYSVHWSAMQMGQVMVRNDSLMNLSPEIYVEFVRPLDQRLFDEFGPGAIHFCGRGDHYIEAMSRMHGLTAIAMSQPHLNDMEVIYRNTVDKKIKLINLRRETAEAARASGRRLHGQAHCA